MVDNIYGSQSNASMQIPSPYSSELAAIQRRERLAQVMQQQALQPLEINSYQGIQAPISPLSGIAKALQMYLGASGQDRADEARAGVAKKMEADTQTQLARLLGSQGSPAVPATPATMGTPEILGTPASSFTPMGSDFEDNPNLKLSTGETPQMGQPFVAPGDVAVPAVPTIPAVAGMPAQPGRPAQPAKPPTEDDQRRIYSDFVVSGNPRLAKLGEIGLQDLRSSGTNDIKNWKASNTGLPFNQWLANQNAQKANRVSVNVSTEKSYGEHFAAGISKDDIALRNGAIKAISNIENSDRQRDIINSGQVFTGKGANAQNELASWGDFLGVGGATTVEKIANTNRLYSDRAAAVLESIPTSGLGPVITDSDLKVLRDAKMGNVTYTKDSLLRQIDVEEKVSRELAKRWNQRFGELPESATKPTGVTRVNIPSPRGAASPPPAGVTQQQWNAMTPDQRKLWP
jgi:hypothetical protein